MKGSTARRTDPEGSPGPPRPQPGPRGGKTDRAAPDGPLEWIKSIVVALLLFFVIRTFLIQAFTIPSGSMENTLEIGDYLMANNAIYGAPIPLTDLRVPAFREPQHGDVVVFRPTYNNPVIDVVKRVVGEPGDTIQMIDRAVHRNGERVEEPYVEPAYTTDEPLQRFGVGGYDWHLQALPEGIDRQAYRPTRDNWGPLVVPEGHYLLLGDNRDESLDSRYMGFIPREVIRGKAMFIYFSVDPVAQRPFPRFLTAARWGRIGQVIQ